MNGKTGRLYKKLVEEKGIAKSSGGGGRRMMGGGGLEVRSAAGENNGSAKVFGFARLHGLGADEALRLFCEHYESVVATPEGSDHGNIRAFIKHGWDKLEFDDGGDAATKPLRLRVPGEVDDADI